jgi:UDP-N-acetyl-D-mannosaminuronate dehydrogenase
MLQITDYCPKGVDGVIVTAAHDEFRGMGLSGVSGVLGDRAVVVDVKGMIDGAGAEGMGFYYKRL